MDKVLIIDDSTFQRSKLVSYLTAAGFATVEAVDGHDGLAKLDSESPDLILLDLLMPGLDGFGVLEALKVKGSTVPIVVLTADIQETRRARCLELGVAEFLNKPPQQEELLTALNKILAHSRSPAPSEPLTELQRDALTELINIGVGKAAAVLNEMILTHVELSVPSVRVLDANGLHAVLEESKNTRHAIVRLGFGGGLTGTTSLVLGPADAAKLVSLLTGEGEDVLERDSIMENTLLEVGNIVINGVMGSISNTVGITVNYSVPEYKRDTLGNVFSHRGSAHYRLFVLANTTFKIEEHKIDGTMFILFEMASFQNLLASIT